MHAHVGKRVRYLPALCNRGQRNDIFARIEIMVLRRDNSPPPRLDYVRRARCNYMPCHVRSELGKAKAAKRDYRERDIVYMEQMTRKKGRERNLRFFEVEYLIFGIKKKGIQASSSPRIHLFNFSNLNLVFHL